MKRLSLALLLASLVAVPAYVAAQAASTQKPAASTAKPAAGRLIEIDATDAMKFSVTTITAKPGEQITVRLKGTGTMPKAAMAHNFVLLKDTANAATFANDGIMVGPAAEYIPAARKADVLAKTKLIGPGETDEITFKVPTKAASYPYLCTWPAHFAAGMKGTLVVK